MLKPKRSFVSCTNDSCLNIQMIVADVYGILQVAKQHNHLIIFKIKFVTIDMCIIDMCIIDI